VIDAFTGELRRRLVGHVGLGAATGGLGGDDTGFTPDGSFVIGGMFKEEYQREWILGKFK
jgi:hypothetical protein